MVRGQADKYLLLTSIDDKLREDIGILWDNYSGFAGLLYASRNNRFGNNPYSYDPDKGFYKIRNRRITDKELRNAVERISLQQRNEMRKRTQQMIAGIILASIWYSEMENLMTILYRTIWTLSIGGFLFDTQESRNAFYLFILLQFKWLDNFYDQVLNKSQPKDGTALTRAGLYASYANPLYQNILLEAKIKLGLTEAKRVLGPNENHCYNSPERLGCIELAQKGWQPIELITPIGDATCYSNCRCHYVFR